MDCRTRTHVIDGATLVSVIVENPYDEPARFRVDNELDGPVRPPRRRGRPESGWDEEGYEGVLEPGEQLALGYAVPAEPEEPAASIVSMEPAQGTESDRVAETTDCRTDTAAVARRFRDPRPPRSALSPVDGFDLPGPTAGDRP
jgi:hypothetical protein